ncbi:MAG: T9SS type A sorting domain-containing protein [Bacteroidota bacterium]
MRHKKIVLSVVLLSALGLTGIQAQEAIPASGGNGSGSGGSVSYTIGQVAYSANMGTNSSVAQGVQQPYEISAVTAIDDAKGISLEFVVYPNPATDFVILKIENYEVENLSYNLYDMNGKLLENNIIQGNVTNISMQALLPSTYFLKVTDKNKVVKTFKIIKK